jgi:uncharacterized protein (TIGR02611 family)
MKNTLWSMGYRAARRVVVTVLGVTLVALGLAMLVLPGPAVVVVPAGLGILALEFAWARRLLERARAGSEVAFDLLRSKPPVTAEPAPAVAPRPDGLDRP